MAEHDIHITQEGSNGSLFSRVLAATKRIVTPTDLRAELGADSVDFVLGFYEKPEDDDEDFILLSRAIRIPSGASGVAFSRVAANAETTFLVRKNGSNIGTVVFAAAATTGTVSITNDADFASGDSLELIAPATADDDLENLQVTLRGILL